MSYRLDSAEPDGRGDLSAEQRGNLTLAHRELLSSLAPDADSTWSIQALWACLEQLRTSTVTAAPEVRVERAWTDGPDAFCIVYVPPYAPDMRVGVRRHVNDSDYPLYELTAMPPGNDLGADYTPAPVAFGRAVADFHIGEPLGNVINILRIDNDGVGWWGSLTTELPSAPT